jgi:hypothetical protein
MKPFVDDVRAAPEGWVGVSTINVCLFGYTRPGSGCLFCLWRFRPSAERRPLADREDDGERSKNDADHVDTARIMVRLRERPRRAMRNSPLTLVLSWRANVYLAGQSRVVDSRILAPSDMERLMSGRRPFGKAWLFATLICISFGSGAWAWGEEGHSIVAEIAQRRLSQNAAQAITQIPRTNPDATPIQRPR